MSDPVTQAGVRALAEPTAAVRGLFLSGLALANLGIMVAFFAPLQNLLPRMSEQIAGSGGKETALAVVTGVGVIGSVIGNPLAGALSDRTTSRFGRRRPWMLGGSLLGFVGLHPAAEHEHHLGADDRVAGRAVRRQRRLRRADRDDPRPGARPTSVASPPGWSGWRRPSGRCSGWGWCRSWWCRWSAGSYLTAVLFVLCVVPFMFILKDPPLAEEDKPAVPPGQLRAQFLGVAEAAPGLRLGVAGALPGVAEHRDGHAVPAVLPHRPPGLRRRSRRAAPDGPAGAVRRRHDDHRGHRRLDLRPGRQAQDLRDHLHDHHRGCRR